MMPFLLFMVIVGRTLSKSDAIYLASSSRHCLSAGLLSCVDEGVDFGRVCAVGAIYDVGCCAVLAWPVARG